MALLDTGNTVIWNALKLYLPAGTRLTSVYRPAEAQLQIIVRKARQHGYAFTRAPRLHDRSSWIGALQFLHGKGYQIAEPGISRHQSGMAYDLVGPDLSAIERAVRKAVSEGRITLLRGAKHPLIRETVNHCVHVEIESALIDSEPFEFG